jgi:hypothetical protein
LTLIGKLGAGTVNGLIIAANIVTSRASRSCLSLDGGVPAAF